MSIYSASFVQVVGAQMPNGPDHAHLSTPSTVTSEEAAFEFVCKQIAESNRLWLEASPEHIAADHTVRTHRGSRWISIQNAIGDELLQALAGALHGDGGDLLC